MKRKKKQITTYFIICSLLLIGLVYAILQANLQINGIAKIKSNSWDVHFDNIQVNENSVAIGDGDSAATIDPANNCKIDFEVTLSLPGDFYEFTVDVVNAGTIDGMIGTLNKTLKVNNEVVSEVPDYLAYTVTYSDGIEILGNHLLNAGATETYLVRLEFRSDIEELPNATTISTSLESQYIQADNNAIQKPELFIEGTWQQIKDAYDSGNLTSLQTSMEAGATREVQLDLDYDGIPETTRHVRIANLSTPAECEASDYSQTACGFVIEFADIINKHVVNTERTNTGGWCQSEIRNYINSDIYNSLPSVLKNVIINTKNVSGYFESSSNYLCETNDYLYFFSSKELYGSIPTRMMTTQTIYYGVDSQKSRQLDYYLYKNVTPKSYSALIKKDNETETNWWTRSPANYIGYKDYYTAVTSTGLPYGVYANDLYGVSPAFRMA